MSKLPISVRCRKDMTAIASKSLENSFKMFEFFSFLFFLTYLFACIFLADVCQNYHTLTDGTRKYDYATVSSKCDVNLNGWYRFQGTAGTKVVTKCPVSMNKCAASFPACLSDDHPTVPEGASKEKYVSAGMETVAKARSTFKLRTAALTISTSCFTQGFATPITAVLTNPVTNSKAVKPRYWETVRLLSSISVY